MTYLKVISIIAFVAAIVAGHPQSAMASWWDDIRDAVEDVADGVIDIAEVVAKSTGVNMAVKLIGGDSLEEVIDEAAEDTKDLVSAASKIPTFSNPTLRIVRKSYVDVVREVYGDDAAVAFEVSANTQRILEHLPSSATESLIMTLEKGDIRYVAAAPAAVLVAAALRQAQEYFEDRAQPLPAKVKVGLTSHFHPHDLGQARFVVNDDPTTLNGVINWLQTTVFGGNHAVVAGNIIIFAKAPSDGDTDLGFWAHEILHTIQFRDLGIDQFAHEYVLDHKAIEGEAEAKEAEVTAVAI